MTKKYDIHHFENEKIPLFSYHLLRGVLLPELLGKDHDAILYWAGKAIARRYPLTSNNEIIQFFSQSGWGTLTLEKEKKHELIFHLTPTYYHINDIPSFRLEAGFLAEQIQQQKGVITETLETTRKRKVIFHVQCDGKDPVYE